MGAFITFEGIEGAGKSTQIALLANFLTASGMSYTVTREPGGSNIGKRIRTILLDTNNNDITDVAELLLYAADRAQHVQQVIIPAIAEGKIVLCDRFIDATTAYQGYGRGLDLTIIDRLNKIASVGIMPSLTFLIDCHVDRGIRRAKLRSEVDDPSEMRFENEKLSFHKRVKEGYKKIAEMYPERVVVIDGNRPIEIIHREIVDIFLEKVGDKGSSQLTGLQ